MSNNLSVRRVIVQTIDEDGKPDGPPTYGVMAADDHEQAYNDTFESLDALNAAIKQAGNILGIVEGFDDINVRTGTDNYYGPAYCETETLGMAEVVSQIVNLAAESGAMLAEIRNRYIEPPVTYEGNDTFLQGDQELDNEAISNELIGALFQIDGNVLAVLYNSLTALSEVRYLGDSLFEQTLFEEEDEPEQRGPNHVAGYSNFQGRTGSSMF